MATTVGLVEDRWQVLEGLVQNVPWRQHGIELKFAVDNGKDALAHLQENSLDILVTDIKMAEFDGLDLARYVYENRLPTKVILISAFDEFEFAQQAIKAGVYDYLLKPIDYEKLIQICLKAAAEKQEEQRIRYHIKNSVPALREKFFTDLIDKPGAGHLDMAQARYLEIDFSCPCYLCGIACIDHYEQISELLGVEAVEVMLYRLTEQLKELRLARNQWVFRRRKDLVAFVLGFEPEEREQLRLGLYHHLEQVIAQFHEKSAVSITFGIGGQVADPALIGNSYQEATFVEEYKFRMGCGRVYDSKTFPMTFQNRNNLPFSMESSIIKHILLGDERETQRRLDELAAYLAGSDFTKETIRLFIANMYIRLSFEASGFLKERLEDLSSIIDRVHELTEFDHMIQWLRAHCLQLCGTIQKSHDDQYRKLAQDVNEYIQTHFQEQEISLEAIARSVAMSSSYLSSVYRRETGSKISDRLTEVRIEHAKLLLNTTGLKIYEVAQQCGFSNQYYFSAAFKKQTGLSPNEYRTQGKVGDPSR